MLSRITEFLQRCPYFKNRQLTTDFLGEKIGAVGLKQIACDPVLYRYADGASLRQFVFSVLVRDETYVFFEDGPEAVFEAVEEAFSKTMPLLETGQIAQRLETVKCAAMAERDYGSACYSAEYRLIYFQRGE